jgi:hypothetical protein
LEAHLKVPGATVTTVDVDLEGRGADHKVAYPGQFLETVLAPNSPYVKLEVGRARVTPSVDRTVTSFVHEHLEEIGHLLKDTAKELQSSLRLKRVAPAHHPAFREQASNEQDLREAYAAIGRMFWGPRLSLEEARRTIREWLGRHFS